MSDTGFYIGAGIAEGIDKAVTNFFTLQKARKDMQREEEEFKLTKKIKTLALQKAEMDNERDLS